MNERRPVILIGFDATEIDLIDELVAARRMPNLARLRLRGRWGRLGTEPPQFSEPGVVDLFLLVAAGRPRLVLQQAVESGPAADSIRRPELAAAPSILGIPG